MDLLVGLPKEVANRLVEKSKGVIETDEHCEKHPRYKKFLIDNELVCPICYREKKDNEVAYEKTQEYRQSSIEGKSQYLYEESIVSNKLLLEKGLKDFVTTTEEERRVRKAIEVLTVPIASEEPMNIYLQGKPGSGKSHLAMGLLRNVNQIAKGKRCLYVNFPTLQQKIRKGYNDKFSQDSEGRLIEKMINAQILVLDDVASEVNPMANMGKVSDFSARILYSVMDARAELKPTIITSNIPWDRLQTLIDPRVSSRISYKLKIISFGEIQDKRRGGRK